MEIMFLKGSNDKKSFNMLETLGAKVYKIEDLEKTDDKVMLFNNGELIDSGSIE